MRPYSSNAPSFRPRSARTRAFAWIASESFGDNANDTSSAGFASDSINFSWGYQTFTKCYNALGNTDTCWSPRVTVDTMSTANLGVLTLLSLSDGVATSPSGSSDTLSCSGYAVQSRAFAPEWDVYMILWAQGITGNKTAAPLDLQFTVIRRIYNPTRSK